MVSDCWSSSPRPKTSALGDHGVAHGLRVEAETFGDFVQAKSFYVQGCRTSATLVVQPGRLEQASRAQDECRDCPAVHPVLCSDRSNRIPRLIVCDQLQPTFVRQSSLRLRRILRDRAPRILSLYSPTTRPAPLGAFENTAYQRFQRRTLV